MYGQGSGRYTDEEIQSLRVEVWEAVNDLLPASKAKAKSAGDVGEGREPFWILGGQHPTEADSIILALVESVWYWLIGRLVQRAETKRVGAGVCCGSPLCKEDS
ncbi:uncharacterized protein BJX67DRAFT_384411 [Aspergillus lucknowensis]|uniref:Metaxin glutathione S-transferase domain-containing protein n=1 Tax=Aspergillus lucknowensis TaxID=176173 RepID=A0ABR4LH54_9EURO